MTSSTGRREVAAMVARVATAVGADAVLCATAGGDLPGLLADDLDEATRILTVGTHHEGNDEADGVVDRVEEVVVTTEVTDPWQEAHLATSAAATAGAVRVGEVVVCVVERGGARPLVTVSEVGEPTDAVGIEEIATRVAGVSRRALEATMAVALRIAEVAGRGKPLGALFTLGDSDRVLEGAHQLVLNPLAGHADDLHRVTDSASHSSLIELAKLDGAFVLRGDGLVRAAGVYLAPAGSGGGQLSLDQGLGARHATAAAVTARSDATAVVVSSTDGLVRVFVDGEVVLCRRPGGPTSDIGAFEGAGLAAGS